MTREHEGHYLGPLQTRRPYGLPTQVVCSLLTFLSPFPRESQFPGGGSSVGQVQRWSPFPRLETLV